MLILVPAALVTERSHWLSVFDVELMVVQEVATAFTYQWQLSLTEKLFEDAGHLVVVLTPVETYEVTPHVPSHLFNSPQ